MSERKLRFDARDGVQKILPDRGLQKARGFGIKIGYWPCLYAPFIEIAFNTKRYAIWYGLPSYCSPKVEQ